MNEEEKIRAEIAKLVWRAINFGHNRSDEWWVAQGINGEDSTFLPLYVDQILSFVRIECSNQDLPDQSHFLNYASPAGKCYQLAQKDMLTPDSEGNVWVKCLSPQRKKARSHILTDEEHERAQDEFRESGSNY